MFRLFETYFVMIVTGQVRRDSTRAVAMGTFNDIFMGAVSYTLTMDSKPDNLIFHFFLGTWLDKEKVALRLPRSVGNTHNIVRVCDLATPA